MPKTRKFLSLFNNIPWATVGPIMIHLSITVPLAATLSIWVDEAYTMNTISGSLASTFNRALNFEMQPPLYFLLLNLWRKLGSSVFFLRLFSVLCTTLTILVASRLSARLFPKIHRGWLTTAVAINPYTIWAATEMRVYALVILLSSFLFLSFYEGFMADDIAAKRKRKWVFICCVLSLYAQYYALFMFAALFFGIIIIKRWEALKKLTSYYVLTVACSLPILLTAMCQITQKAQFIIHHNNLLNYLSVGTRFLRYSLRLEWMPAIVYMLMYPGYLAGMLYLMAKYGMNVKDRHKMIWIIILVMTLCFLVSINRVNNELVNITHTTFLFIPSLLVLFSVMDVLPDEKRNKILIPAFFVILSMNTIYMVGEYRPMAKLGDCKRVAEYITTKEEEGQSIIVFIPEMALPFSYYYSGKNIIIPIPNKPSVTYVDLNKYVLNSDQDITGAIEREGLRPKSIKYMWMVNYAVCQYLGVNYHCEILEEFIKNNFTIEDDKSFYYSRVRLLRWKNGD